ncbi:hypothetical protein [Ectothiorhodospira lacustris]|uniref:hypothetical protein n=1 Tax=Ectothiorhodospira lacustris TaxID=2899127 RepID=UPI001EE8F3E6|nr:hypothetical protein [Ectothiorhodospira lacustris]MCG5509634.1 hypothetical protein [Ectothiorhodospira lacustris]MCG5521571.1 hypothetical protein [Ectothiorhodospira lacustris]
MTTHAKLEADLEKVRAEIARVEGEIDRVEHAPLSRAEAETRIDAWVDAQASRADLDAYAFTEPGGLPDHMRPFRANVRSFLGGDNDLYASADLDLSALFCALAPERVKELLKARLPADSEAGAPMADRPAIIAKLRDKRRALEIREEEICDSIFELTGTEPARRPDVDLALILAA